MRSPTILPVLLVTLGGAACAAPAATATPAVTPAEITSAAPNGDAPLAAATVAPAEATASPTPVAFVPALTQLTEPGCCIGAEWTADGRAVRFIDQPAPGLPTTYYTVDAQSGGDPQQLTDWPGSFSPDDHYLAMLNSDGMTIIIDRETDTQWPIRNGGREVHFSPSSERLAWSEQLSAGTFSARQSQVWVAGIDGENPQAVITLTGGGFAGWIDDDHLLLYGRNDAGSDRALLSLSLSDGETVELARGERIRGVAIAAGGAWVAYTVTFEQDAPEENGLWIVSSDGSQRHHLDVMGGTQWRDGDHLLIVPLEMDAPGHWLLQADAATGEVSELIDPEVFSFRIYAGEWKVAPTGDRVAFVSAEDQALYAFTLPPLESASE